jgi:hypothetical protein
MPTRSEHQRDRRTHPTMFCPRRHRAQDLCGFVARSKRARPSINAKSGHQLAVGLFVTFHILAMPDREGYTASRGESQGCFGFQGR